MARLPTIGRVSTLAEARAMAKRWSAGGWDTKISRVPKSDVINYNTFGYRYFLHPAPWLIPRKK